MKPLYPVYIKLSCKKCLVVGGGKIAQGKAIQLLKAKAAVTIVSPTLTSKLSKLVEQKKIEYMQKTFKPDDLTGFFLVIAATNNTQVNTIIFTHAEKQNMLVNVVDVPELCNFYVPSVFQNGDLMVAISTNGKAPALARLIRLKLQKYLPKGLGKEIKNLSDLRNKQKEIYPHNIAKRSQLAQKQARKVMEKCF